MTSRRERAERTPQDPEPETTVEQRREQPTPVAGAGRELRAAGTRRGGTPTVARRVHDLQRSLGNQHVIGVLHTSDGWSAQADERTDAPPRPATPPIQRYAVNLPASAKSPALVEWLNASSPHAPGWAKTTANFSWTRSMAAAPGEDEGTWIVTVADASVTKATTVDMPMWTADNQPMRDVWDAMWSELRAHEAEHEQIADGWETTLEENLGAAEYVVTADSEAEAKRLGLAQADGEWTGWIDQHQADQSAIDPFYATLNYPAEEEEEAPDAEGEATPIPFGE